MLRRTAVEPLPPSAGWAVCQLSHTCRRGQLRRGTKWGSSAGPRAFKSQRDDPGLRCFICRMGTVRMPTSWGPFEDETGWCKQRGLGSPERNLDNVGKRKGGDAWRQRAVNFSSPSFLHPTCVSPPPEALLSAHDCRVCHAQACASPSKAFAGPSQANGKPCVSSPSPPGWASKGISLPGPSCHLALGWF